MSTSSVILFFVESLQRTGKLSYERTDNIEEAVTKHTATFHKGYKSFIAARVNGRGGILQGAHSDVWLNIPEGLRGVVYGCVHTDPWPFLNAIPDNECLVAPIVEYHFTPDRCRQNKNKMFVVKIRHCVKEPSDLSGIVIRHGDIHNNLEFETAPTPACFYEVDEQFITIYTTGFSQFICTRPGCVQSCVGQAKAFVFGKILPYTSQAPVASLRLYVCSPLHDIKDYENVM